LVLLQLEPVLRRYTLTHREDIVAFQTYVDRSLAAGRMISIDPNDSQWEENLANQIKRRSIENR
jgi:hypothetical protein